MTKYPAQQALEVIDGHLLKQFGIRRLDAPTRTKVQKFEVERTGRWFGVIVQGLDTAGRVEAQQTRVLLEVAPPPLPDVEPVPASSPYQGGSVISTRLAPERGQRSAFAASESGLRHLLEWYADVPADTGQVVTPHGPDSDELRMTIIEATNTILYGPPGTGKTWESASRAVRICDGQVPSRREDVMKRYEELRREERVRFVTFHQSYGYEDFVEGLRPFVENGQVAYRVEPGVFRKACDAARRMQLLKPGLQGKPLRQRSIYKMSLGAKKDDEGVRVFQECLEKQCILLGYGGDVDFTGCRDEEEIRKRFLEEKPGAERPAAQFVNIFMHELKVGDIVIVSYGNRLFRAIAEVTGEYGFLEEGTYHQMRPVKWLAVLEDTPNVREVFDRDFVQRTIYRLAHEGVNFERLEQFIHAAEEAPSVKPYVLIIDEINRANISKVFGELITLLEPDKREGALNAITLKLPHSGDFSVPSNLHIIGTMNTADRSIALLDTALRRRFQFEEVMPDPSLLNGMLVEGVDLSALLASLNDRIEALYDRDHTIGHAYLLGVTSLQQLETAFRRKVLPLLQEYFYENWERIRSVLGDHVGAFVTRTERTVITGNGSDETTQESRYVYAFNKNPFPVVAFKRIYGAA